jgi:hypothetical protein
MLEDGALEVSVRVTVCPWITVPRFVGDTETSPAKLGESCTTAFGSFPVAVKEIVVVEVAPPATTVGAGLAWFQVSPGGEDASSATAPQTRRASTTRR